MVVAFRNSLLGGKQLSVKSFADLKTAVQRFGSNRNAARAALLGIQIPDTWTAEDGTVYDDPMRVVDVDFMASPNGMTRLRAVCQRVYATLNAIQFDQREQEAATEATAQDGIYYYGWSVQQHDQSRAYSVSDFCIYNSKLYRANASIAANTPWNSANWGLYGNLVNGAISAYDSGIAYSVNDLFLKQDDFGSFCMHKYKSDGTLARVVADMPVSQLVRLDTLSAGDQIPYASYLLVFRNSLNDPSMNIIRFGHNNYGTSAYSQYIDSDAAKSHWASKQHVGQLAPDSLATCYGYKAGCSAALLAAAEAVQVPYWPNYVTDGPNSTSTVTSKNAVFWLPSGTQMLGNVQQNEGTAFPYWTNAVLAAMEAAQCTILKYVSRSAFPAVGEAATVYFAENTSFFYYWNSSAATPSYAVCNNDDRQVGSLAYDATKGCIDRTRIVLSVSNKSTATHYRCRSANRYNSYHTWYVNTAGFIAGGSAYSPNACIPCCAI